VIPRTHCLLFTFMATVLHKLTYSTNQLEGRAALELVLGWMGMWREPTRKSVNSSFHGRANHVGRTCGMITFYNASVDWLSHPLHLERFAHPDFISRTANSCLLWVSCLASCVVRGVCISLFLPCIVVNCILSWGFNQIDLIVRLHRIHPV
jgi:hypothetical protein